MKIYHYDEYGFYTSTSDADRDPLDSKNFLIPAKATKIERKDYGANQALKFDGVEWHVVPDYSGKDYWHKKTKNLYRFSRGEEFDDNYTDIAPEGNEDEFENDNWKISEAVKDEIELHDLEVFLKDTDWYEIRRNDPKRGDDIPAEIASDRKKAVLRIEALRAGARKEYNLPERLL